MSASIWSIAIGAAAVVLGIGALGRLAVYLSTGRRLPFGFMCALGATSTTIAASLLFLAGAAWGGVGLAIGAAAGLLAGWPVFWLACGLGARGGAQAWTVFVLLACVATPVVIGVLSVTGATLFP